MDPTRTAATRTTRRPAAGTRRATRRSARPTWCTWSTGAARASTTASTATPSNASTSSAGCRAATAPACTRRSPPWPTAMVRPTAGPRRSRASGAEALADDQDNRRADAQDRRDHGESGHRPRMGRHVAARRDRAVHLLPPLEAVERECRAEHRVADAEYLVGPVVVRVGEIRHDLADREGHRRGRQPGAYPGEPGALVGQPCPARGVARLHDGDDRAPPRREAVAPVPAAGSQREPRNA